MNDKDFKLHFPKDTPRKNQRFIIDSILDIFTRKKYVILSAPTGVGKSAIAYTIASYFASQEKKTYILTNQKMLQDQYFKDFFTCSPSGIATVKGKNNYVCKENPKLNCDRGLCLRTKYIKNKHECPYKSARDNAYKSKISVLNYSYFINMANATINNSFDCQSKRHLVVLDECHSAERELLSHFTCDINKRELKNYNIPNNLIKFPKDSFSHEEKYQWLEKEALYKFINYASNEESILANMDPEDKSIIHQTEKCSYLSELIGTIERVLKEFNSGIPGVVNQNMDFSLSFKLLYAKGLTPAYYYNFGERFLFMSATVFSKDQFCSDMGLDPEDVAFIQVPSTFPKENRPIYPLNIGSMNYKNIQNLKPKIGKTIKDILEIHKNEKGIIGVTSFDLAESIVNYLQDDRLLLPKGKNREKVINQFMNNPHNDTVLISPSIFEGLDCTDKISKFCIITKIPYGNLGDPFTKLRMEIDPSWYQINTINLMIQLSGRSIRSNTDKATTYILDSNFIGLIQRNRKYIPKWWLESINFRSEVVL